MLFRSVWNGAENVRYGAENVRHGAKNMRHGAKNMRHGAESVRHGAKNVRHHIVTSKKFLRISSSPHQTLPNDNYDAPEQVGSRRKLFHCPLKK